MGHTELKGRQEPSKQVNSGHMTVVFLPPGGTGVTVLSGEASFQNRVNITSLTIDF